MRKHLHLLAVAGLALAAGGCHSDEPVSAEKLAAYDYRLNHPVTVEPRIAVLRLSTASGGKVSTEDRRQLASFGTQFLHRGTGVMDISVGAVGAADATARAYGRGLAAALLDEGLKVAELRLQLVIDEPAIPPGTALLRFTTNVAQLPECYDWADGERNATHPNFGCATQRNMGAMMADPRDLDEARPMEGHPGDRGDTAIDKLGQGTAPWSVPLPWEARSGSSGGGQ